MIPTSIGQSGKNDSAIKHNTTAVLLLRFIGNLHEITESLEDHFIPHDILAERIFCYCVLHKCVLRWFFMDGLLQISYKVNKTFSNNHRLLRF